MFEIHEHNVPANGFASETEHEKLLSALREELEQLRLSRPLDPPPCLSLRYGIGKPSAQFAVKGYTKENFSPKDDISVSVVRANLARIVTKDFANGIAGNRFFLVLSFSGDPFQRDEEKPMPAPQEEPRLNILPVEPRYRLDQMILEDKILEQLEDVITLVSLQDKIYDQWGFSEVDPKPRAIINFFGPSGTGKTMAAHALAHRFGKKILVLNYADIESKFVGDAPKNLMAAFEIAKEHDALLFFDEADSFLGKRITHVSQSADQAVNSLRSQMLMLLEEHSGTVIFATNLMENYDSAFQSRILRHIQFSLPVPELRLALIRKMMPAKLPHKGEDFTEEHLGKLVELSAGFSGREIKNAMLNGIIRSARNGEHAEFEDIRVSFENAAASKNSGNTGDTRDELKKRVRNKLRKAFGFDRPRRKKPGARTKKLYRTVKAL